MHKAFSRIKKLLICSLAASSAISASAKTAELYNPNENKCIPPIPGDPFGDFRTTGINRETMHTTIYSSYETERDAAAKRAVFSMNLNGSWKFHLYPDMKSVPEDFMKADFDDSAWHNITVPSCWQLDENVDDMPYYTRDSYIFDAEPPLLPAKNPTGCYRIQVRISEEWMNRDVRITFHGVDSAFQLWVNGQMAGYSEDSRLPAEFAVTQFLHAGENTIAVKVARFSTGSYLESQDVWHMSGIYRDVQMIARPKVHLRDWSVRTTFDKDYKNATLDATVYLETRALPPTPISARPSSFPGWKVSLRLVDAGGRTVAETAPKPFSANSGMYGDHTERGGAKFSIPVNSPLKWSPEHPNLYRLFIRLYDENNRMVEVQCQNVGFRQVEIRNQQVLLNGKRLVVRGVNRHDFSAYHGFSVTEQEMRADIAMMKKLNFNAVRTCHYPDNERWYELCDELGIALVDETNLETQGIMAELTNMPEWSAAYLERAQRMVLRDRNHPSILFWSLGNESGTGASHAAMANWIRFTDPSRPVQYESDNPAPLVSDILAPMYPRVWDIRRRLQNPDEKRPLIMCEYAYAKGNATGNFFKYWDLVRELPSFQGGFLWDWADKALFGTCIADDKKHLGYGNDLGENFDYKSAVGGQHPTQVLNGIVAADLTPHPGAEEVRVCQAPITAQLLKLTPSDTIGSSMPVIRVNNEFHDTDLNEIKLIYTYTADGGITRKEELMLPDTAPGQSAEITLKPEPVLSQASSEQILNLFFYQGEHEITRTQFFLSQAGMFGSQPASIPGDNSLIPLETADSLSIGIFTWSKKTGKLVSIKSDGKELLDAPAEQLFYRAPTDNDLMLDGRGTFAEDWKPLYHPEEKLLGFTCEKNASGSYMVKVKTTVHCIDTEVVWFISKDNALAFTQKISFTQDKLHSVARVGMMFPFADSVYNDVNYYGRGPHENYPDRQQSALIGLYSSRISDLLEMSYLIPSENGSRGDIRFMNLRGEKESLRITPAILPASADASSGKISNTLRFSALPVSPLTLKDTAHSWQLRPEKKTWLILDGFHMGLGGDDGWSINTHQEYLLRPGTYQWGACMSFGAK